MKVSQKVVLIILSLLFIFSMSTKVAYAQSAIDHFKMGKKLFIDNHPKGGAYDRKDIEKGIPQKSFEKGIEELLMAIKLDPELVEAYVALGDAYILKPLWAHTYEERKKYREKYRKKAEEAYKKAIELDPQNPETHYRLLMVLEDESEIEKIASKILELDPNHPEVHAGIARGLEQEGKIDEAIIEYQKHIEININKNKYINEGIYFRLAELLKNQGRKREAIEVIKQYINSDSKHIVASQLRQRFDLEPYKEYKEFVSLVEKIKNYGNKEHINKAYELLDKDRVADTMKEFKLHININPYEVTHYIEFGKKLEKKGKHKEAILVFKSLLDSDNSIDDKCRDITWLVRDTRIFNKDKELLQQIKKMCK